MRSTRRQVAAENGQVGRSTQTNCMDAAEAWAPNGVRVCRTFMVRLGMNLLFGCGEEIFGFDGVSPSRGGRRPYVRCPPFRVSRDSDTLKRAGAQGFQAARQPALQLLARRNYVRKEDSSLFSVE